MNRTFVTLLASSSLLAAVGCADGTTAPPPGPFTDAEPENLVRAVGAASGMDAFMASFVGGVFAGLDEPEGCPRVATVGATTTVTAGCDTDDGRAEGRIVLSNVPGLFGEPADPAQPQVSTFESYTITDADGTWFLDGEIRVEDGGLRLVTDFTLSLDGHSAHSELDLTRDADGNYTAGEGSQVDVEGFGEASVSGTWNLLASRPSGELTLTGEQILVLDFDAADDDGCVPYTIDGVAAGTVCNPTDDESASGDGI